jgi:hypothetical protein
MQSNDSSVDRHYTSNNEEGKMLERNRVQPKKAPAFSIRHRVDLELDMDLALALGDHLLSSSCPNPALVALAHQLQNLLPPEKDD